MVNDPIGEPTLASPSDYIEVAETATRITFSYPRRAKRTLALLVAEGLGVEYAAAPQASKRQAP